MTGFDFEPRRRDGDKSPLDIAISILSDGWPDERHLHALAGRVAASVCEDLGLTTLVGGESELSLVFTDDAHIRDLNAQWRGKDKPTNVLSFPAFSGAFGDRLPPMLGDIVLARETIAREAELDGKPFDHHLVHLIVHGFLHLLGHDHETDEMAENMEDVERRILAGLAIPDPYAVTRNDD